jgi:hypothetical protein
MRKEAPKKQPGIAIDRAPGVFSGTSRGRGVSNHGVKVEAPLESAESAEKNAD